MADQPIKNTNNKPNAAQGSSGSGGSQFGQSSANRPQQTPSTPPSLSDVTSQAAAAGRDLKDKAVATSHDLRDKVTGLASSSAEAVKEQASELAGAAKDFVAQAGETLMERATEQKSAGADYVGTIADTLRRAAREFDRDLPIAGTYIRKAAERVDEVSDSVRQGDVQDLLQGVQSFARRQPTAFLGLAVLAGFGVVRFLKSSAADAPSGQGNPRSGGQAARSGHIDARRPAQQASAQYAGGQGVRPGVQR